MSDIVYEMTLYAKRAPEPYIRWAGEVIELKQRIRELEREVRYLRAYGNKDCTAMADEAMANSELKPPR